MRKGRGSKRSAGVCGLFVSGVNTGVGKTYVAAMIARALRASGRSVGVYKPVASGCSLEDGRLVSDDAVALWKAAGEPGELAHVCPQSFALPTAPHLAARAEGKEVDAGLLRQGLAYWMERSEIVIVEGAGGLMTPVSDDDYVADLAHEFGFPLVIVAANELGAINLTLQTLITAAAFRDGLPVAGVVLSDVRNTDPARDPSIQSNAAELAARCIPPLLAHVKHGAAGFESEIDWRALACQER